MKHLKIFLCVSIAFAVSSVGHAEVLEQIVAKVNGRIVTLTELRALQMAAVQRAGVSAGEVANYLRTNNLRILQDAIDEQILLSRAEEIGIDIRDSYIDSVIEDIKVENGIASDEQFQAQLRREGMSLRMLRENVERSIVRRQVISYDLDAMVTVEDAEVIADYEARKDTEFFRPASVNLQEIVVESRELAEELTRRALAGEDFAALAGTHSTAPTADTGGDLGRLEKGDLNAALEAVAFSLDAGEISDPLPIEGGFRILRVVDKSEASRTPFEDVKPRIVARLSEQRRAAAFEEYIEGLRDKALIDIMVREVPMTVPESAGSLVVPEAGGSVAAPADPATASDDADEFSVSPQAQPEKVLPPAPPGSEAEPAPTPSPTPEGSR